MNADSHSRVVDVIVDGETLHVPDMVEWEKIRKEHAFRGWPVAPEGILLHLHEECLAFPTLRLALGKIGKAFDVWRPYVIVDVGGRPTRIHLVWTECENCAWRGRGGTTAEPDLFIGFGKDMTAKYVPSQELPSCPCPRCHRPMPDHIVWCEGATLP